MPMANTVATVTIKYFYDLPKPNCQNRRQVLIVVLTQTYRNHGALRIEKIVVPKLAL